MTPISYTIRQACEVTGLGRTSIYLACREGRLEQVKIGRRTLILARSLHQFIEGKAA